MKTLPSVPSALRRTDESRLTRWAASLVPAPRAWERLVVATLVAALLLYAPVAVFARESWVSGAAAPLVALLLARRHRRARFAAYVFLSVIALRTALSGHWDATLGALAALLVLQTPAACRLWPRVMAPARMSRP